MGNSRHVLNAFDQEFDQPVSPEYAAVRESFGHRPTSEQLASIEADVMEAVHEIFGIDATMTPQDQARALAAAGFTLDEVSVASTWLFLNGEYLPYDDTGSGGGFWDEIAAGRFGDDFQDAHDLVRSVSAASR